jgi:hypothetical protein
MHVIYMHARGAWASADQRSGPGKRDTPNRASMVCCATRRASHAALRISGRVLAKVMDLICSEPPGHVTHWTGRAMSIALKNAAC